MSVMAMDENTFMRFKPIFKKNSPENSALPPGAEGKFFRLWGWALPLLFGFAVGWLGMACLEVWLEGFNGRNRHLAAESSLTDFVQELDSDSMEGFLRVNPFRVTPMLRPGSLEPDVEDVPPPIEDSLAEAILRGTSPGYMAWLEVDGNLRLVRLGDSFDAYILEEVTYLAATFVKDDEYVVKEMAYGGGSPTFTSNRSLPDAGEPIAAPQYPVTVPSFSDIDTSQHVLGNPFEEISKIRIIPMGAGQGLKMDWLGDDSILAQLGVEKGDVLLEINNVATNNVIDIGNSLISGGAPYNYTLQVLRDGAPTTLEYYQR